jgi:PAS domain S-box-containing protein
MMNITKPIVNKLQFIVAVGVVSLFIVFGAMFYYRIERNTIRNEKYNELTAIANLKVSQLEQWFNERLSEVQFFSQNEPYINIAKQIVNGNAKQKFHFHKSISHILTNKRYNNIFMLNKKGELVFSVDTSFTKLDDKSLFFTHKVYETKNVVFSDFYFCQTHKTIHLDIFAPILSNSNEVIANLVFRVNPEDYLYPLIQNWPTPSRSAETLLVRKDGDSVQFLNRLRHSDSMPLSLYIPLNKVELPAVQAIIGTIGIFEGKDYRGVSVLSKILPIKGTPWFLIAKVDSNEIFSELYTRTILIIIISTILILLVGASVAWFYNYRQRNIYRKLLASEIELHQSQEEFRATLYSIGDGVITTDRKGNVKQLNPVAELLTGWKEKDAMGKKLEEVFNIINEETRTTVENPVSRVLKDGLIVGLANHTLLISKNGTEVPIADSGAPIKNAKGEIVGVVMVFRDQSEERAKQNELQESEAKFRSFIESAPVGIVIANREQQTLYINKKFIELTGYNIVDIPSVEEWWQMAYPDMEYREALKSKWISLAIDAMSTGSEVEPTESMVTCKDGSYKFLEVGFVNVGDINIVTFVDITERKNIEIELKKSKEFVLTIIENLPIGLAVNTVEPEVRFEFMNKNFFKFYGVSKEAIFDSDTFWDAVYEDAEFREMIKNKVLTDMASGDSERMQWFDIPIQKEGKIVKYITARNIPLPEKGMVISTVWDVTERKKVEESLRKSEEKLSGILNNIMDVVWSVSWPDFKPLYLSPSVERLYGRPVEEFIENPSLFMEIIHPDDQHLMESTLRQLKESGEAMRECRIVRPDGSIVWVYDKSKLIYDDKKQPVRVEGIAQDITERKHMEESIRESEKQFRQLVDNAPQGIFVQTDGVFVYINPIATKLFGARSYEELLGTPVIERFHPNYRDIVKQRIAQLNHEKKIVPLIEEVCLKIDGTPFDTEVSAAPISYSGKSGALVFFQDITERKKADNELIALKNDLEIKVKEKTKELSERVAELERFHDATIDREVRMKELREEIKKLKGEQ